MNYKLIQDKIELEKFINFLPELKENEGYFLILVARSKWNKETGLPSATKLRRETVNTKTKIFQTIKHWEVEEGSYTVVRNGITTQIPLSNIGIYAGYNPKNQYKAAINLAKACIDAITNKRTGINVKSMANDYCQTSFGTKHFVDIDCDRVGNDNIETIIDFVKNIIGPDAGTFVKTRGGFHCLVNLKNMKGNHTWYKQIQAHQFESQLELFSNDLIPIPGCNQGDFVPYMISK